DKAYRDTGPVPGGRLMALTSKDDVRRVDVHDGWVDVRAGLGIADLLSLTDGQGFAALSNPTPEVLLRMLQRAVVAWSYDEEVTPEAVDRLDMLASIEVFSAVREVLVGDEKK